MILAALAAVTAAAQTPAQAGPTPAKQTRTRRSARYTTWSAETSRRLFALCDRNRDDRLTYREARRTLHIDSTAGFRLYDTNRDGRLHRGEFDRLYKEKVKSGRGLVLYGEAAAKAPPPPVEVAFQVRQLFTALDRDRSRTLSPAEWDSATNPVNALLPGYFLRLDRDRNNLLALRELKALEKLLPGTVRREAPTPAIDPGTLPRRYQKVDRDGDNMISRRELELLLKGIDPALPRWTGTIFTRLDRNRNGRISPREIRLHEAKKP